MSPPSSLGLFGVIHMDRLGKVTAELDAFVDDADAVFVEYPREFDSPWLFARLLVRVPTYLLGGMLLQLLLYAPLYVLFVRDLFPAEVAALRSVVAERDLPTHRVDDHPNMKMRDAGLPAVVLAWAALAAVAWLQPVAAAVTAALALGGGLGPVLVRRQGYRYPAVGLALLGLVGAAAAFATGFLSAWLLLAGVVAFFAGVVRTIWDRNAVMLDRVERLSAEHGYEDPVLVTGKGHLGGLAELARERALDIRAVHVPRWLRAGTTHEDPADVTLPRIGFDAAADAGTERDRSDESPHLTRRATAALLDLVFGGAFALLGAILVFLADEVLTGAAGSEPVLAAFVAMLLGWLGYHTCFEALSGQTAGKRLLGLRVVRERGGTPSLRDALVRNLLRPVDAVPLYGTGLLVVLVTSRHQRLGDLAADTVVVRTG